MPADKTFAFVLMPFANEFDDIYNFGIKDTAANLGIRAERVDEQIYSEGILERIYRQIDGADIIIADMTGQNPNVFYEVGYAHAKSKICILLTQQADDIPFDLKHKRHIVYGGSISNLKDNLKDDLEWALQEISNIQSSRISVSLESASGNLEKTKYTATAEITFKIDLINKSDQASQEISACYFYSSNGWRFTQDGQDCPSKESDLPDFHRRHFLYPPVHKLHNEQWAQLRFKAKKTLATAYKGEELKDSYSIAGRSILRLVTKDGSYDYEIPIDITVDEFIF
jgi:hypothetical protein